MAGATQISVEEYLQTSYDGPEPEYVAGEVIARSMPDLIHAVIQLRIGAMFLSLAEKFGLTPCTEIRVRLAEGIYRIIDVAMFSGNPQRIPSDPPVVAVEIVSPDDKYNDLLAKLDEYREWGVQHIWLVEPGLEKLHVYDVSGLREVQALEI